MKTFLMGAVALAAIVATPAMAEDFTVQGTVTAACSAVTGTTIDFGTLAVDSSTGVLTTTSKSVNAGSVWCNGVNSTIAHSGSSITNTATTSDPAFTSTLGFTREVKIGTAAFDSGDTIGAIKGDLTVAANSLNSNGKLPVAGSYSGIIAVTLTPSL